MRRTRANLRLFAIMAGALTVWQGTSQADTILASKHDLSVSGPGNIRATAESEVCLFCHTPHRGTGELPLWNHVLSQQSYKPYSSSTSKALIGQPTGASKLCLSCHDGTVALGMVASRSNPIQMRDGVTTMPVGPSNLGTDLSDDHPVSFNYDQSLAAANGELKDPASLNGKVHLDHNGQLQCTACHDPHDNQFGKFLVENNYASALCLRCHDPKFWQDSAHRISNKTWSGSGLDPWPKSELTSVAANACGNCHASHNAGTGPRLLNYADEEQNCFVCHSGNVAAKNVQPDFNKFSAHPVLQTTRVHDPMEDPINAQRHVECTDCHNPHAARTSPAVAPNAPGALAGLKGVNSSGAVVEPLSYAYELCYRCHADSLARGTPRVERQFPETNVRMEFDPGNASFHPVETAGRNQSVPSLLPGWTAGSRMYCTDCHNNDQSPSAGGTGANGPHGSRYRPILERELVLTDGPESSLAYALCYKCHDRSSILRNDSFRFHNLHVVQKTTACTTCHDPHGVKNQAHLINFSTTARAASDGRLEYRSTGFRSGTCTVSCHGKDHVSVNYAP